MGEIRDTLPGRGGGAEGADRADLPDERRRGAQAVSHREGPRDRGPAPRAVRHPAEHGRRRSSTGRRAAAVRDRPGRRTTPRRRETIERSRAAGETAALQWDDVGPASAHALPRCYHHDGAVSVTWEMADAPRTAVIEPVLSAGCSPRTATSPASASRCSTASCRRPRPRGWSSQTSTPPSFASTRAATPRPGSSGSRRKTGAHPRLRVGQHPAPRQQRHPVRSVSTLERGCDGRDLRRAAQRGGRPAGAKRCRPRPLGIVCRSHRTGRVG